MASSITAHASFVTDATASARRESVYRPARPLNLLQTVGTRPRGPGDPTMVVDGGTIWIAMRTPVGLATLALRQHENEVHAVAWGAGAELALDSVPRLCGRDDDDSEFDASRHPLIAHAARRHPGLRLGRTDQVFDSLVMSILEQKVTAVQAFSGWRALVRRFGAQAPGPSPRPLFAAPTPDEWHVIASWEWHRAGVEPPQSRTIVRIAERGERIAGAVLRAGSGAERDHVLTSLPGVGVWTAAETRARALGDADAVSVGDYHLAHQVGYALTGSRTDDAGMLELLAPWAGQRQRVIRLIMRSGVVEPRRGPRLAPEDHRRR